MDLGTALTIAVLLASAAIAVITAAYHMSMLARRTTWEYFSKYHLSEEWGENAKRARFFLQKKSRQELSVIAGKWSDRTLYEEESEESSDVAAVLLWLNRNEFIAIFLLNKTIHMKTYAQAWGWEYIEEWKLARDFIRMLRLLAE